MEPSNYYVERSEWSKVTWDEVTGYQHFLSVSPVLIGFSTHFIEEFVAAEFILI